MSMTPKGGIFALRIESLVLFLLAFFFTFEHAIVAALPSLAIIDEVFAIVAALVTLAGFRRLAFWEHLGLVACIFLLLVGLMGNVSFGLLDDPAAVGTDVLSIFKVFLAFYFVCALRPDREILAQTLALGVGFSKLVSIVSFLCMVASQFVDLGMSAGVRYGFESFAFVFDGIPGNFSKVFYLIIPLLIYGMKHKCTRWDKLVLAASLVTWCSTMRSRAFAFVACTLLLLLWFLWGSRRVGAFRRIKPAHVLLLGAVALFLAWDQLVFYFTNETQARGNLLHYAFVTADTYFPIGSGFGTFGSNVAAEYYSPLYVRYGFNFIWGMSSSEGMFLNDNYWPMILGQFGYVGLALVCFVLFSIFSVLLKLSTKNVYVHLTVILLIGYLLLSSIASKSYSEFSSMGVFMYMGVFLLVLRANPSSAERARGVAAGVEDA